MTIYIIMMTYVIILSVSAKMLNFNIDKRDRLLLLALFVPLVLISGLRASHVGTDTANYMYGFNLISNVSFEYIFDVVRWEEGYVFLNKIASLFSSDSQTIIIVTSFFILFFVIKGIYESSVNRVFSVYLYVSMYYYFVSFNAIRQFLAISLILYAYKFIRERKFIKYAVLILIASSFHKIAILFIPVYFLFGIKLNIKKIIILGVGMGFALFVFDYLMKFGIQLFPEYDIYLGTKYFDGGGILTSLVSGSIVAFGLFIKATNRSDKEFDFLFIIAVLSFITSIFSMNISIFNRLNYYFAIFNILFIPKSIYLVKDKRLKINYSFIISVITLTYFILRLLEGWQRVTPFNLFTSI